MTWLAAQAEGSTPVDRVLGLRPDLRDLFAGYLGLLWANGLVDPVVLELCRLRIAHLHGDAEQAMLRHDAAVAAGLTEAKVAALPRWYESPHFSAHERACIGYAETFVIDVHALTDADADAVKAGMSDGEFVAFTVALGMFDGLGRFRLVLGTAGTEPPASTAVPSASAAVPSASAVPVIVPAPRPGGVLH